MGDSVAITLGLWSGVACTGLRNPHTLSPKREDSGLVVASMRQKHRSVAWGPASRPSPRHRLLTVVASLVAERSSREQGLR